MLNLDDSTQFQLVLKLEVPEVFTFAGSGLGKTDPERREQLRQAAEGRIQEAKCPILWWAFRIRATKAKEPWLDADNIPKVIIDAFCKKQIDRDRSKHEKVGLYDDDSMGHVRYVEVHATPGERNHMTVEVFGKVGT